MPIWERQWAVLQEERRSGVEGPSDRINNSDLGLRLSYDDEVYQRIKSSPPLEVSGRAGTIILWHGLLAHVVGCNASADILRTATIFEFHKTVESLPDTELKRREAGLGELPLWGDWSEAVQRAPTDVARL